MKLFLMIACSALLSVALYAADLAGAWKGSMETQSGTTDVTIKIKSGAAPTGTVQLGDYEGSIEEARLDGDEIAFVIKIGPGTLKFDGTVEGDELKLNVTGTQGNQYKLICKRQK